MVEKTIKIDEQIHRALKVEAAKQGLKLQVLVESVLKEWLEKNVKT